MSKYEELRGNLFTAHSKNVLEIALKCKVNITKFQTFLEDYLNEV